MRPQVGFSHRHSSGGERGSLPSSLETRLRLPFGPPPPPPRVLVGRGVKASSPNPIGSSNTLVDRSSKQKSVESPECRELTEEFREEPARSPPVRDKGSGRSASSPFLRTRR